MLTASSSVPAQKPALRDLTAAEVDEVTGTGHVIQVGTPFTQVVHNTGFWGIWFQCYAIKKRWDWVCDLNAGHGGQHQGVDVELRWLGNQNIGYHGYSH
jgi:hypothetical protein